MAYSQKKLASYHLPHPHEHHTCLIILGCFFFSIHEEKRPLENDFPINSCLCLAVKLIAVIFIADQKGTHALDTV